MSASIPSVVRPSDCCATSCDDTSGSNIPGPAGPAGANGSNGTNGTNAFTTTTAAFTMPAISANVAVTVAVSSWASVGQVIYISNAGYFSVAAVPDATHITATNLGYTGNVVPTTVVGGSQTVSPAGIKGTDGAAGSATLNDLSPTTTKGDIIVDNGANNPLASDVRLAVGTDGQMIAAVAAQPTGLQWQSIIPNSATDNAIPRFNGASGTPIPLQTSLMEISDVGAVQSTPTGGNARGANAVDLQVARGAATEVASGTSSAIGGGAGNTASGNVSVIAGGSGNTASGLGAVVSGGVTNTASGPNASISGGVANTASNTDAFVGGGINNVASGSNSTVSGGAGNVASGSDSVISGGTSNAASGVNSAISGGTRAVASRYGQISHASGRFAADGDAQSSRLMARIQTTTVTPAEMFLDGATLRLVLTDDTTWGFVIYVTARRTDANDESALYKFEGAIDRNVGVGTTALVAAVVKTVLAEDTAAWDCNVTADAANGALVITATGENAKTINWVARIMLIETTG